MQKNLLLGNYIYKIEHLEEMKKLGHELVQHRLRLVVETDYTNITEELNRKVRAKIEELGYFSLREINLSKGGWLKDYKVNQWNQFDYKQDGGFGTIPMEKIVEITIAKR